MVLNKNTETVTSSSRQSGFTLIELLVVIAIIGILSTLAVVALSNARSKARDSKRVADIQQISKALELYYADNSSYPTIITPGQSLKSPDGLTTYMAKIPNNPTPRTDNNCPDSDYGYGYVTSTNKYALGFCLGNSVSNLNAGVNLATNEGLGNNGLVGWWKFDETSGTAAYDSSNNGNNGTLINGPTWQSGINCKIGGCLQFNGTNQAMQINKYLGDIINGRTFSITFYAKPLVDGSQGIITDGFASPSAGCFFDVTKKIWCGMTFTDGSQLGLTSANNTIQLNSWQFFSFTDDGTTMKLYGNGVKISETNSTSKTTPVKTNYKIGIATNTYSMYNSFLNGLIDDIRIYNRALSDAEVLALYSAANQ